MRFSIKTYIIIFVIIVSIGKLTCSIDSLLTQLDKVENNERIQTLFDLAYEYYNQNQYEKSKEYADKALLLSKRTENNLYTADILYFLGVHNNVLITNQEALEALWQALDIYEVHKKENDLAWTYNQIGVVYEELKINEKALIYFNKAQNIFEKL